MPCTIGILLPKLPAATQQINKSVHQLVVAKLSLNYSPEVVGPGVVSPGVLDDGKLAEIAEVIAGIIDWISLADTSSTSGILTGCAATTRTAVAGDDAEIDTDTGGTTPDAPLD